MHAGGGGGAASETPRTAAAVEAARTAAVVAAAAAEVAAADVADAADAIDERVAARWMLEMSAGLTAVHEACVAHRDLKARAVWESSSSACRLASWCARCKYRACCSDTPVQDEASRFHNGLPAVHGVVLTMESAVHNCVVSPARA